MTPDVTTVLTPEGIDTGVPAHYGDPLREQRVLATSAGVVDRSNRGVLIVPGEDRLSWLHTICSQHVSGLADGDSTEALVLSPHGHVEQHWQVTELAGTVWLDVEPGTAAEVLGYLQKMRFLKRVEPADVSASWVVLTLAGPAAGDVLRAGGMPDPSARAVRLPGGGFVRTAPWGVDLVVPRTAVPSSVDVLRAAGAAPAGVLAFEALRVEARRPRLGLETDHRTIPHEVGWIGSAVHLDKGCYRGQETVARVQNLGRPPRRLVLLHLAGESEVPPPPGTPVELDGRAVGFLGTAVYHYELGPIALAVIKRSVPDGAALTVAGSPVAVD
jgi:hypothetical protein